MCFAKYYVRKDPVYNNKSDQDTIAELDSSLNTWLDAVPDHLKWNPARPASLFMRQSVFLYMAYCSLQIFIHRPFIPTPRVSSSLSFPSLTICTNAARACIRAAKTCIENESPWVPMQPSQVSNPFQFLDTTAYSNIDSRHHGWSYPSAQQLDWVPPFCTIRIRTT